MVYHHILVRGSGGPPRNTRRAVCGYRTIAYWRSGVGNLFGFMDLRFLGLLPFHEHGNLSTKAEHEAADDSHSNELVAAKEPGWRQRD